MNFKSIQSVNRKSDFKTIKNLIAVVGMISILALAYGLDLLLSQAGLSFFVEGVSQFLTWHSDVWLMPISFIIFSLAVILLTWYVVWHSKTGSFVRLAFLAVGIAGLLLPTILHTLYSLFGYSRVGFLVADTIPLLNAYLRSPYLFYQAFGYLLVIGTASVIVSRVSAD